MPESAESTEQGLSPTGQGTILITGATGCLGGELAKRLARSGQSLRAIAREGSDTSRLEALGVPIVRGDVRDQAAVDAATEGASAVIHFAGLFRNGGLPDQEYRSVHVGGTSNLLSAARRNAVTRFVHCSTIGVHGSIENVPADESAPTKPTDIYQQTKLEGEQLVQAAIADGFPGVVVRPAGVYGPGDDRHLKLLRLLKQGRFVMFGDGRACWHPVFIEDLLDGFEIALKAPKALGNTYIMAGPRWVPLAQWIEQAAKTVAAPPPRIRLPYWSLLAASIACETLCKPIGIAPPLHKRRASFFVNNRAFSIDKARREIGYDPKVDIEEGLARTAAWYRQEGLL